MSRDAPQNTPGQPGKGPCGFQMCWETIERGTDLRRPHRASSALICFFTEIMCQVSAEDTFLQAEGGKLRGWWRVRVWWAGGGQGFGKGLSQRTQGPVGRRPRGGSSCDDRRPVQARRQSRAGPGVGGAQGLQASASVPSQRGWGTPQPQSHCRDGPGWSSCACSRHQVVFLPESHPTASGVSSCLCPCVPCHQSTPHHTTNLFGGWEMLAVLH